MTGKELLLVLAGTTVAAGAGGIGAAAMVADGPAENGADQAVLAQLEKLSESLDSTNEIMTSSRDEIAGLKGRIDSVETRMRGARKAESANGRRHVGRSEHASVGSAVMEGGDSEEVTFGTSFEGLPEEAQGQLQDALVKLKAQLKASDAAPLTGRLITDDGALQGIKMVNGHLAGLHKGLELRRLPEEERWEKAREEIGLTNVQEDEIKAALAERDQAIEDSMQVERDEEDGSSRFTVRSMDFEKTRAANEAYRKRVDNTLNDEQKKSWRENGYDNAFGKGAMGSATVISVSSFSTSEPTQDSE